MNKVVVLEEIVARNKSTHPHFKNSKLRSVGQKVARLIFVTIHPSKHRKHLDWKATKPNQPRRTNSSAWESLTHHETRLRKSISLLICSFTSVPAEDSSKEVTLRALFRYSTSTARPCRSLLATRRKFKRWPVLIVMERKINCTLEGRSRGRI